jgi:hypothetical protein
MRTSDPSQLLQDGYQNIHVTISGMVLYWSECAVITVMRSRQDLLQAVADRDMSLVPEL